MIQDTNILGLIPARGGSKGIPRKNIRDLGGKPLISWTIDEAQKSRYIDKLVVSTDDKEIAEVACRSGADVPFMRPAEFATDTARGIDVVLHALKNLDIYELVVLLQPTSPFRSAEDIDGAIKLWAATGDPVVGVTEPSKSPYWMYSIDERGKLRELIPKQAETPNRQDLRPVYVLNGALYIAPKRTLQDKESFLVRDTRGYEMPMNRSIDLDTEDDWLYCEWLVAHRCQELLSEK